MTHLQKCKLFAYGALVLISGLEIFLFCALFNTSLQHPYTFFSIVSFVVLFNTSVWWFRGIYDRVLQHYAQESKEES